jgi:hypothetical protein
LEKRYQVFVSSTYADLKDERQRVIQTLMELDCIPAGMELFPAADQDQFEFIKRVINDCDYYLVIVGGRYGSITAQGISYTEQEYHYALDRGLKVVALLHENPDLIPLGKSEQDPGLRSQLQSFRDKLAAGRLVRFWRTADELPGIVALSMSKTIRMFPAVGWVRADKIAAHAAIASAIKPPDSAQPLALKNAPQPRPAPVTDETEWTRVASRHGPILRDHAVVDVATDPFVSPFQGLILGITKREDLIVLANQGSAFAKCAITDGISYSAELRCEFENTQLVGYQIWSRWARTANCRIDFSTLTADKLIEQLSCLSYTVKKSEIRRIREWYEFWDDTRCVHVRAQKPYASGRKVDIDAMFMASSFGELLRNPCLLHLKAKIADDK